MNNIQRQYETFKERISRIFVDDSDELFVPKKMLWGQYDYEDAISGLIPAGLTIERSNEKGYFISIPEGWSVDINDETGVRFLYNKDERVVLSIMPRGFWEKHSLTVFWEDDLFKFKIKKLDKRPARLRRNYLMNRDMFYEG